MKKLLLLPILLLVFACDGGKNKPATDTIYVSIAPLAYIVEHLVDSSVVVEVLVPETTSPETYEPTPMQIAQLSKAQAYINIGLIDFEVELNRSVARLSDSLRILDLSKKIHVLGGSCSHGSHDDHGEHSHGVDPHTWLSPRLMRQFAIEITDILNEIYPSKMNFHLQRLTELIRQIDSLDGYIKSKNLANFAIAHPSLTYYAKDYGVEQIAIEIEGKEPTMLQMKNIVNKLRGEKITRIFHQTQVTAAAAAETIAREVGAGVVEFDPLAKDWIKNLYSVTDQIAR